MANRIIKNIKQKKKIFIIIFVTFLIILIYIINPNINTNLKVCLCVIGKKENLYALEFVNHYKNLGYDHIFIYDNNDINDERLEDVIYKNITNNFVTIINYRGYRGIRNSPQFDAYYDCYQKNYKSFEWLSFFDFDEFLDLKIPNQKIKDFLINKRFRKCANIKINWLIYSDNDLLYYENRTIRERFLVPNINGFGNTMIKSTIKGNLKDNYWKNMANPHSSNNAVFFGYMP